MNPLVNPGAITARAWSPARARTGVEQDHRLPQRRRGAQLSVLQDVYKSGRQQPAQQAIGALMLAYTSRTTAAGRRLYTRQCSIGVNAKDLAMIAATRGGGKNP
jgi:glutaminase